MKYEITDETEQFGEVTLYRIQALKDFGAVKAGNLGGWVANQYNLSQEGDCWVGENARVSGDAWVGDNARVGENAWVSGDAWVRGNAQVSGDARVRGNAVVNDNAQVRGNAVVSDNAQVSGDARVSDNAWVSENARVIGYARVGTHEKSQVPEFNFSNLPSEVEEVVIAGVRYKKETTWKKI
jgi:acyl-[acyl carrier protein]--UDP-N-acetylglucosamine O-acyltransferase